MVKRDSKVSDWGKAVKSALVFNDMSQKELVQLLNESGYEISEYKLSRMLRENRPDKNTRVLKDTINYILGIDVEQNAG